MPLNYNPQSLQGSSVGGRTSRDITSRPSAPSPIDYDSSIWNQGLGSFINGNLGTRNNNVFSNWLFPSDNLDYQEGLSLLNDYYSPQASFQGLVDSGINPNTAAAGVSGAGSSSLPQSASSTNPVGDVATAATLPNQIADTSSLVSSRAAQSEKALADAEKARSDARNADRLADAEILSKAGSFSKALTESGTPEIAAMELALKVVRGGLDGISNSLKGDGICRLIQSKQDQIEADYSKTWKEIEQIEKMLPLIADEQEKKNALLDIDKRKQNAIATREQLLSNLWTSYNGDPYLDLWQRQYQIFHDYGPDSPQYKSFLDMVKNFNYFQSYGQNLASMEIDWLRPPTSVIEAGAKVGTALGGLIKSLKDRVSFGSLTESDAKSEAMRNPSFVSAYNEARQKLKDDYEAKKKLWKDSRGMNNQERAQRYNNYQEALRVYDEFDKDAFFEMTWSNPLFTPAH